MRILLVEDNYLIAMELEDILRTAGHEVVGPFATSEEAVRAIVDREVDGGLLDFRIGNGDSTSVAEELLRRACPFAFVTGYAGAGAIPSALEHVTRIKKPFREADILSAVERFRGSVRDRKVDSREGRVGSGAPEDPSARH